MYMKFMCQGVIV